MPEVESANHIYSRVIKPKREDKIATENSDAVTLVPVEPVSVVNVSTDDVKILSNEASSTIVTVGSPSIPEDFNVSIASPSDQVVVVANSTNKTWLSSNDVQTEDGRRTGKETSSIPPPPPPLPKSREGDAETTVAQKLDDSEVVVLSPMVDRHSPVDIYEQSGLTFYILLNKILPLFLIITNKYIFVSV